MVMDMEKQPTVRHAIEDDLIVRREQLAWQDRIPHPDLLVQLVVDKMTRAGENNVVVVLRPQSEADCLCQFVPGQYPVSGAAGAGQSMDVARLFHR